MQMSGHWQYNFAREGIGVCCYDTLPHNYVIFVSEEIESTTHAHKEPLTFEYNMCTSVT